jgi:hypothetical protein
MTSSLDARVLLDGSAGEPAAISQTAAVSPLSQREMAARRVDGRREDHCGCGENPLRGTKLA